MADTSGGRSSLAELRSIIETWDTRRTDANFRGHRPNLVEFVGVMNAMTRKMVAEFGVQDPLFYTALAELATNAATMVDPQAKLIADGQDVSDL